MKANRVKQEYDYGDEIPQQIGSYSALAGDVGKPVKKTQIGFVRQKPKRVKRNVAGKTRKTR